MKNVAGLSSASPNVEKVATGLMDKYQQTLQVRSSQLDSVSWLFADMSTTMMQDLRPGVLAS